MGKNIWNLAKNASGLRNWQSNPTRSSYKHRAVAHHAGIEQLVAASLRYLRGKWIKITRSSLGD